MFERLACDPNVSVKKLERLMALKERADARTAEMAFNAAMADAQEEMRPIAADASNPQTHSRYASYAQLDRALRPIYTRHGFALSFNTDDAPADQVRVLCEVSHRGGHSKLYRIDMPADGKGAKGGDVMTRTHATGSAVSYGKRYLVNMIWNVSIGESDDDGNAAGRKAQQAPVIVIPQGYDEWCIDLVATADRGTAELEAMWKASKPEYRAHITRYESAKWLGLKQKADGVRS
jgi:ERF superfamily